MSNNDLVPWEYWTSRGHDELYAEEMDFLQEEMKQAIAQLKLRPRENCFLVDLSPVEARALLHDDVLQPLWAALSDAISTTTYEHIALHVEDVQLSKPVLELLAPALNQSPIRELCLKNNRLPRDGVHIISRIVQFNSTLKKFAFCNPIESAIGATSLAQAVRNNTTIDTFSLNYAGLGQKPMLVVSIFPALHNAALKTVALGCNQIKASGAGLVADFLSSNPPLEKLVLFQNDLTDNDVRLISKSLRKNTNLQELNLLGNKFGIVGAQALLRSVYNQSCLNAVHRSNHTCLLLFKYRLALPFLPLIKKATKEAIGVLVNDNGETPDSRRKAKLLYSLTTCTGDLDIQRLNYVPIQLMPYLLTLVQGEDRSSSLTRVFSTMREWRMPWLYTNKICNRAQRGAKRKRNNASCAPTAGVRRSSRIRKINK